ncbi:restriction endonuclease subunit S [Comamonas thiooxydans]|uniref:restriction endonuclease subunit S n=1 Tax=Comamonas thiooxydans TaxID=363952 RepID=UPI00244CC3B7|nr:restriction endonuclease subunit S [Comamonas thiooxydans]MDH1475228.1 restriction endonuclease subunit S [Comamonas thiooxydans]
MHLPSSWIFSKFDELNEFRSFNINPASFPLEIFDLYSVPIFPTRKPEKAIGKEIGSAKQIVEPSDVLISKINPRINRVWQVGPTEVIKQIASSEWIVFRNKNLEERYFLHYFCSPSFRERLCADVTGVGGSLTRAQPKRVAEFLLPVAPLSEQRRIADKLDTILTRVDALNDRLARITPLLKRFRQSVLAAATSGRLTEDWRGCSDLDAWRKSCELRQVTSLDVGFAFKSAEFKDSGIRLLRGDSIEPGGLRWREAKYWASEAVDTERHLFLALGDVVLAMDRPIISTGLKVARVKAEDLPCLLVQRVCRFRTGDEVTLDYIHIALQSSAFVEHLLSVQNGSSIPHISSAQILSFRLHIPPLSEQTEIVRRVEILFAYADRLEARLQTARTTAERLTPALLAKAFRGDLVPQDPNDEPASELLRRLREARVAEVSAKPKRGRKSVA